MKYEIIGGSLPAVECTLTDGEILFTESGGMSWMTPDIEMSTNAEGGLFGALGRAFSGESLFLTSYISHGDNMIAFASSFPGSIKAYALQPGEAIIAQKSAFLAAERSVKLETFFQKKFSAGFFGGEGFILQKITGPGIVFLEIDGFAAEYELQSGQELKVDTGHIALYDASVQMDVQTVKGVKNILFGGEGLFLTSLRGPGRVVLQTMPMPNFAGRIAQFLPTHND